jgi:Fe-coproporphyrin III synthase
MVGLAESVRRISGRLTHRIESLPILALTVHTACNCRCVMCDIWKANADNREISVEELDQHLDAIRRLHVQRVMLTGGEPLLHRNLWRLCQRLRDENIRLTLVTTGLLVAAHVDEIAMHIDELVISVDGPAEVHDHIRRVRGGFDKIARGVALVTSHAMRPRITARTVVQRLNHARLVQSVAAIRAIGFDHLSFLAADVTSTAFNRPKPWSAEQTGEVALARDQVAALAAAISDMETQCQAELDSGFIVGGIASLWRIHDYYAALAGLQPFPPTTCNAPWVSAVVEPGGQLRPCFFHPPYSIDAALPLDEALNAPAAVTFRRGLDVRGDEICKRCVCTISVGSWSEV